MANVGVITNSGFPPFEHYLGRNLVTLGAGSTAQLGKDWSAFINYYCDIYADGHKTPIGHTTMLGLSYRF